MRARYGWERKTIPFSRTEIHHPDGYRMDAAGFVSMCFKIPLTAPGSWGGLNTVNMLTDGWFYPIQPHDLKPGDVMGQLGEESLDYDGGTVVVFEKWLNDDPTLGVALTWEHLAHVSPGPDQRGRPINYRWNAYRYRYITDEEQLSV
jgi:hypothetical protein